MSGWGVLGPAGWLVGGIRTRAVRGAALALCVRLARRVVLARRAVPARGIARALGLVGVAPLWRLGIGPEDLGLDPLERLFQDAAQVADDVLAYGA